MNFWFLRPRLVLDKSRLQELGSEGEDILCFQRLFNKSAARYSISTPLTGVYDEETRTAVSTFQRYALNVLNTDGFVGPETAKVLRIKLLGE